MKKQTHAKREFDILNKNVKNAIIAPFEKELIALVDKFDKTGQSGASAPYTASALSNAVKDLCLRKPLYGLMFTDDEWNDIGNGKYQNNRLSAVFKDGKNGKPYYLDAIVFRNFENGSCFTGNSVLLLDGSRIGSRQYIKESPFKPKTFYIDVIKTEWYKDPVTEELTEQSGGGWWSSVIYDESQLDEVFEYYDRFDNNQKVV